MRIIDTFKLNIESCDLTCVTMKQYQNHHKHHQEHQPHSGSSSEQL